MSRVLNERGSSITGTRVSRRRFLGQAAALAVGTAAPAALFQTLARAQSPQVGARDQIVLAWSSRMTTLDSADHYSISGTAVLRHIYDPLLDITSDGKLMPALAESWRSLGETGWEFKLRKGVRFHNGELFTANSVKRTLDRLIATDSKLAKSFLFVDIAGVEMKDLYTVLVHTKKPFAPLPYNLTVIGMYPPQAMQESGFFERPVGSGPYKFESQTRGEEFRAVANEKYWKKGVANIPKVVHRFIPETTTRLAGVQSGEIDVADRIPPDQVEILNRVPGVKVMSVPAVEVQQWLFNVGKKPFDDQRVRNAISYAIDRTVLIRDILKGQAQEAVSPLPPGVAGHSVFAKKRYDPSRSRELLRQAGIAPGFELDFIIMKDLYVKSLEVAQVVAGMLEQVGLKLRIRVMEAVAARELRAAGNYDMFYSGWVFLEHDPDYYYQFHFSKVGAEKMTRYNSPKTEASLPKTRVTDPAERQKALEDVSKMLWEEEAHIWPWYSVAGYAVRDRVQNFQPRSDYYLMAMGARLS